MMKSNYATTCCPAGGRLLSHFLTVCSLLQEAEKSPTIQVIEIRLSHTMFGNMIEKEMIE
jgi:hypothetical protein